MILANGATPDMLEKEFPAFIEKYFYDAEKDNVSLYLQKLTNIHLDSKLDYEIEQNSNRSYIYILSSIALFLLLIAAINFMNLSTATSGTRAREIGIKKAIGVSRTRLITQFMGESLILTYISLLLAIILVEVSIPSFNTFTGKDFELPILLDPNYIIGLLILGFVTGVFSGIYPAFYLSAFKPLNVLNGDHGLSNNSGLARKVLVVIQFMISITLIIGTMVIFNQLNYLKNIDHGFDKENMVILNMTTEEMAEKVPVLKENLKTSPDILSVGSANTMIGRGSGKSIMRVESAEGMVERGINNIFVDHDFIETVGIRILEGRDFSEDFPGDTSRGVIINQTLAKRLNWDNPVGKMVILPMDSTITATVVGLMADYYQFGLYNVMEDQLFMYYPYAFRVYVKTSGKNLTGTLEFMEEVWTELYPEMPFEYTFLDEEFGEQFEADEKRGIVYTVFTILTVLIACMGLFGLSSFVAELRTKEIGIRKVHGSSVAGIVGIMLRSYVFLILISIVLASVISWYFTNNWLEGFVNRTGISWVSFVLAGLLTIAITVITVSYHTIRSANVNPSDSLRDE
jgi:putative ABC transport system permease protein